MGTGELIVGNDLHLEEGIYERIHGLRAIRRTPQVLLLLVMHSRCVFLEEEGATNIVRVADDVEEGLVDFLRKQEFTQGQVEQDVLDELECAQDLVACGRGGR